MHPIVISRGSTKRALSDENCYDFYKLIVEREREQESERERSHGTSVVLVHPT